jgi:hypothetical protein
MFAIKKIGLKEFVYTCLMILWTFSHPMRQNSNFFSHDLLRILKLVQIRSDLQKIIPIIMDASIKLKKLSIGEWH